MSRLSNNYADVFAKYGAKPEEPEQDVDTPEGMIAEFVGPKPEPTAADVFAKFGAEPLPDPTEPVDPVATVDNAAQEGTASDLGLDKIRSALVAEGRQLAAMDEADPRVRRMRKSFVDRWVEQGFMEREEELSNLITLGGKPIKDDPAYAQSPQVVRRLEEVAHRWAGTFQSATHRALGNEKQALDVTKGINAMMEYNDILDRDSVLGKKYGPLFGQISSTLGVGTLASLGGGTTGVAGYFGLDSFNSGIEAAQAQGKSPQEQFIHGTISGAISLATTLAGGELAKRAGVSAGEGITDMMGKAATSLFTKQGLQKLAVSSGLEGLEEGVEAFGSSIENYMAGTDPQAMDNMLDNVLTSASTGALVGSVAQVSSSIGNYDAPVSHYKDLMDGWAARLKKNPPPSQDGIATKTDSKYAATPDGGVVSRKALENELHVLQELEKEVSEQFENGGARELRQQILEREDAAKGTQQEINDLVKQRQTATPAQRKNLQERISILQKYRTELDSGLKSDKQTLSEWTSQFEEIHKGEREFIQAELDRISELKTLPDPEPESLTKQETAEGQSSETSGKAPTNDGQASQEAAPLPPQPSGDGTGQDVPAQSQVSEFKNSLARAEQEHVNKVRKELELDNVPARERMATDHAFAEARRRGLPDKALELATDSLNTGRILDAIELAGVQTKYVDLVEQFKGDEAFLRDNPHANEDIVKAREASQDARLEEINTITEAWVKSSSEAGAALQAQQRILGEAYSAERALTKARRNKGEALTKDEVVDYTKLSQKVQDSAAELAKHDPGTEAYDRADFQLTTDMMEYNASISNKKPSWLEKFNSLGMMMTLSMDLVPLGRQGFATLMTNPKQTLRNIPVFSKILLSKKGDSEFQSFLFDRQLREMPNFKALKTEYGVPMSSPDVAFNEVEGSSFSRLKDAWGASKLLDKLPHKRFEAAYRTWLNHTRFTMANIAYESNKHLLDQPGGKAEMQTIIDNVMNMTGHSKADLGEPGRAFLTAPRWMISRIQTPAKALKYIPQGIYNAAKGRPHYSRYLASQYMKILGGSTALAMAAKGMAEIMYSEDATELNWNPLDPGFGYLNINGRHYDMTGGMGFAVRQFARAYHGSKETITGVDDNRNDADTSNIIGGILEGRGSPIARLTTYLAQSGVPAGSREKMAISEYALRQITPLGYQSTYDAAKNEGFDDAAAAFWADMFGVSNFQRKKK